MDGGMLDSGHRHPDIHRPDIKIHESATHAFWNCIRWMTDIMQQFDPEHINPLVFTLPLVATMVVAIWCLAENKKLSEI